MMLDFGTSYMYAGQSAMDVIRSKIPVTVFLAVLSMVISYPIGILLGVLAAVFRGKKIDTVVTLLANLTACLPQFWIALMGMYVFSLKLKLLPSNGFTWPWIDFGQSVRQLTLPLICLSLGGIAGIARQTRSSMLEVIRQDYVRTARSKGLSESRVIFIHVMRNGLIPIITMLGNRLAGLIGGSLFIESVFAIPGMGTMIVNAINRRDLPVIQGVVVLTALISCLAYIVTDLLYVLVDPRITLKKED